MNRMAFTLDGSKSEVDELVAMFKRLGRDYPQLEVNFKTLNDGWFSKEVRVEMLSPSRELIEKLARKVRQLLG